MDDALGLEDPHSASNLQEEHPDGVLTEGALGCRDGGGGEESC